ncbi:MAG: hypothetical protein BAJALOKI3v1_90008 [Promethearchaeota archaeon]|nr:MAG: hypothetical protein BAJALOKI3v1_90008 [Candidatus Lokiarchaeota archaeon]
MYKQSKNYYLEKKNAILNSFSTLLDIMIPDLTEYLESDDLNEILSEFKESFNNSLSDIPYIGGRKNFFSRNLAYSSPAIVFWKVLKDRNVSIEKFAPIYLKALKLGVKKEYQGFKGLIMRFFQKLLIRKTFLRIAWKNQEKLSKKYTNNFIVKPIKGKEKEFDFGYLMLQCPIVEFGKSQNAEEILPFVCAYDWYRAYHSRSGLIRSKTIAEGNKYCDFKFKPGNLPKNLQKTQIPDKLKPEMDC